MREIVPAVSDPSQQVYASATNALGFWIDVDARPASQRFPGSGLGFGYTKSRRESFPHECAFVVRVEDAEAVEPIVEMFKQAKIEGKELCVVSEK